LCVNEDKSTILKEKTKHSHLPPKNLLRKIKLNQLNRNLDDLTEKLLKIMSNVLLKSQQMISKYIENIRQKVYRTRQTYTPKLLNNLRGTQDTLMNI